MADKIIVLDFGSQYNQLIARRIREFGVYSELHPSDITPEEILAMGDVKGIIFSGGPNSVYEENSPKCDPKIFTMALDEAGCNASEAFMIGDRLDNDIIPAKKLGMKTVWVRQGYAVYQTIDDESKRPDHIADSIDELSDYFLKTL